MPDPRPPLPPLSADAMEAAMQWCAQMTADLRRLIRELEADDDD